MIEEIHFILHVVNGIHILSHNVIWYNYMYSYGDNKVGISTHILVSIPQYKNKYKSNKYLNNI